MGRAPASAGTPESRHADGAPSRTPRPEACQACASADGPHRSVVALDAQTGELLWVHGEHEGKRSAVAPRQLSGRGLSYWTDGRVERILYITIGFRLVELDAKTGTLVSSLRM